MPWMFLWQGAAIVVCATPQAKNVSKLAFKLIMRDNHSAINELLIISTIGI